MRLALLCAALTLAGCATDDNARYARADVKCKVYPIETATIAGGTPKNIDPLKQKQAQAWLGTSDYRLRTLARDGPGMNNIEDALRDCNR